MANHEIEFYIKMKDNEKHIENYSKIVKKVDELKELIADFEEFEPEFDVIPINEVEEAEEIETSPVSLNYARYVIEKENGKLLYKFDNGMGVRVTSTRYKNIVLFDILLVSNEGQTFDTVTMNNPVMYINTKDLDKELQKVKDMRPL